MHEEGSSAGRRHWLGANLHLVRTCKLHAALHFVVMQVRSGVWACVNPHLVSFLHPSTIDLCVYTACQLDRAQKFLPVASLAVQLDAND